MNFFRNFLAGIEYERNLGLKCFSLFPGLSQPVLDRNNAGINIFNFLNFFFKFSWLGWVGTEFGFKILFHSFSVYLIPFWLKTMPLRVFFNFLNFFAIFLGIFLPGSGWNGIWDYNFFLSFPGYLGPFWLKIMLERGFLIFLIFLLFFSEFSCPGWVWTEFGANIFFSHSQPVSSRFGYK